MAGPATSSTPPSAGTGVTGTGATTQLPDPFAPDTSIIFGDPSDQTQQDQYAYGLLQNIYNSSFTLTPIEERTSTVGWSPHAYLPGGSSDAQAAAFARADKRGTETKAVLAGQLYNEVTNLALNNKDEYTQLQQDMYLAGFYGKAKLDTIDWGALNDQSYAALTNVFQLTAQINSALKSQNRPTVTWEQVLDNQKSSMAPLMQAFLQKSGGSGPKITLADPNALAQALDQVSQNTIGRRATADEQRMFVAGFHAMQSADQSVTGGGTAVSPDVQGEAQAQIEQNDRAEKTGYDMLNTFGNFVKIMGG